MSDAVIDALERDEAYRTVRVLASKASGRTELVVPAHADAPFYVRKRIPIALANPEAWTQLAHISHPHLPHVVETYVLPDTFVTVCDYVEGFSVEQLVGSQGRLDAEQTCSILSNVCAAAGTLHAHGIIHRDITPSNVVVAADGAHLIDLGIARVGDPEARHDTTKLGTWGFAAPEQYGFAQTDARSDVYSIGGLAGYMLTGVLPGTDQFDAAVATLPSGLQAVIERARSFEPGARYASAADLLAAFTSACSEFAPPAQGRAAAPKSAAAKGMGAIFASPRELWSSFIGASAPQMIAALVALFCFIPTLGGMFSAAFSFFSNEGVVDGVMGMILSLFFVWLAADIIAAILAAGMYRDASSRPLLLAKRGVVVFVAVLVVCMALDITARLAFHISAGS